MGLVTTPGQISGSLRLAAHLDGAHTAGHMSGGHARRGRLVGTRSGASLSGADRATSTIEKG